MGLPSGAPAVSARAVAAVLAAAAALWGSLARAQPTAEGGAYWVAEGGDIYRENKRDNFALPRVPAAARLFYAKLGDCVPRVEGTASSTPLHYSTGAVSGAAGTPFILQADCANNLRAYVLPEGDARPGGPLTLLWEWSPPAQGPSLVYEPLLTTPVIVEDAGIVVVLHKGLSRLFALDVTTVPPTELPWSKAGLSLCNLLPPDGNASYPPNFCTWSEDHAITYYGGRVWIPSGDYFGALLVDPRTGAYTATSGLGDNKHKFFGTAGGRGGGPGEPWTALIFNIYGAAYGVVAMTPDAGGTKLWISSAQFESYLNEFTHPVTVQFKSSSPKYDYSCVISSEASGEVVSKTGLYIAATDTDTGYSCANWPNAGFYVRHPAIGDPRWVSAPAVITDGAGTVFLAYAINRQNGGAGGAGSDRVNWRSAVVLLQADRTGVYEQPVEYWDVNGAHIDMTPVVLRNAFGDGQHGIAVATSHGQFLMFNWRGFTTAGPTVVHNIVNSLPAPVVTVPGNSGDPDRLAAHGNYMLVTRQGTFALVSHNSQTEEMYLQVLVGANGASGARGAGAPLARVVICAPRAPPNPRFPLRTPAAPVLMATSAAPAAARSVNVAAAVFGTMGALLVAAAGIVFCLPTAGFHVGSTKVVPAEYIRSAAAGVYSGAAWVGAGAYNLVAGGSSGRAVPYSSSSSYGASASSGAGSGAYTSVGGERSGLMKH